MVHVCSTHGPKGNAAPVSCCVGCDTAQELTCLHSLHTMRHPGSQSLNVRSKCIFPDETV